MIRPNRQPTITYEIEDADAIVTISYILTVSYTKCKGYPATWGYNGGCPGEPDHVDDVTIEAVEVRICDVTMKGTPEILEAIREKYDGSLRIEEACCDDACREQDCDYDDRDE